MTGFTRLVDREHTIVVYPDGIESRDGRPFDTYDTVTVSRYACPDGRCLNCVVVRRRQHRDVLRRST